jgi:hypothetical protein
VEEIDQLEDVVVNMLMADNKEQLNKYTVIAITLILKINEIKGGVRL